MKELPPNSRRPAHCRAAFTLAEVVIATLLMGLVLVGAMKLVGASLRSGVQCSRQVQAALLAEDLMNEILAQYYIEPNDGPKFGKEGDEASETTGPRALWDDVDDYKVWDASPPEEKDGTVVPNTDGWRRWVEVKHVAANDLSTALPDSDDQGVKRVTVNVSYDGELLATLTGVQTEAWLDMIPEPDNDQTTGSTPPANQPPTALAGGSPTSGEESVTVHFDATGSTDPEANPLSYSWDFGDGGSATGSKPSHTYTNSGESTIVRTATLTVTDIHGATDVDTMTITIYGDD